MEAFTLSDRAIKELASRIELSSCVGPTASLLESSEPLPVPPEIVEAVERNASEEEMLNLANKRYGGRNELAMHLDVGIYDEAKCQAEDLIRVDGVQFTLPAYMRSLLESCRLDYVHGQFVLVREGRTYHRLLQLAEERHGPASQLAR